MERALYSMDEACVRLGGIAKNTLYRLLRSQQLASVVIGRRRFIAAEAIAAFVANTSKPQASEGAPAAGGSGGLRGNGTGSGGTRHR